MRVEAKAHQRRVIRVSEMFAEWARMSYGLCTDDIFAAWNV